MWNAQGNPRPEKNESRSDLDYLKVVIADVEKKSAPIEAHNKCASLLKEYSDITTTYKEISQGDYISKLIEQQRKRTSRRHVHEDKQLKNRRKGEECSQKQVSAEMYSQRPP